MRFLHCSLALIFTIACPVSVFAAEPPAGFQPLFNGVNLNGLHGWDHQAMTKFRDATPDELSQVTAEWTADAEKRWSVENGELVNDGHGKYLATDGNYQAALDKVNEALAMAPREAAFYATRARI